MSVFRIQKTANYTVMSNHHFKEKRMSLKSKGLLSLMLSLPDTWDYSISGLATLSKDGKDSIMSALVELEKFGYLTRTRLTNDKGQFAGVEYNIFELPQRDLPTSDNPSEEDRNVENPNAEKQGQLNNLPIKDLLDEVYELLSTKGEYDAELISLYRDYIKMRNKIEAPITEEGLSKLIDRAKRLSKGNMRVEKILLEAAVINNWKNIYPPRESELAKLNEDMRHEMRNLFGLED